jgi:cell division protein FtsQ
MPNEPETLPPDVLADEEPKYLRRQKRVEIRRRRFGRRSLQSFRRWAVLGTITVVVGTVLYVTGNFFLFSPRVILRSPDQILISGNHFVSRASILEKFYADRGRSVLRVPLGERRAAIEEISWVESATVERLLPNRIRVEVVERTPVGFLRLPASLALVDVHGVILDHPSSEAGSAFHFPVVAGFNESTPREQREQRMQLFTQFLKEIDEVRPGAADRVSEVELADAKDLRAVLTGASTLGGTMTLADDHETVLVHFGDTDFAAKYRTLAENFSQWRASTGRVDSVDLRFSRQVVVNPETSTTASKTAPHPEASGKAR